MIKQKLAWLLRVVIMLLVFVPTSLVVNLIVGFRRIDIRQELGTHAAAWRNITK